MAFTAIKTITRAFQYALGIKGIATSVNNVTPSVCVAPDRTSHLLPVRAVVDTFGLLLIRFL